MNVTELAATIMPDFRRLFIPSKGRCVGQDEVVSTLQGMYENGESDDGLVFSKQ